VVDGVVRGTVEWTQPPGLVAVEPLPLTVSVAVRGSRSAVRRAERADVRLRVDVSALQTGAHLVELSAYSLEGLPASVQAERISPSSVGFTLDEISARKVVVDPVLVGAPAPGFHVASALPDPLVVSIRGPRVAVQDRIEVRTRPIDVTGLDADASLPVRLDLPRGVELVGEEALEVVIDVEAEFVRRRVEKVPVVVWPGRGADEGDWRPDPEVVTVQLEGAATGLSRLADEEVVVFAHLPEEAPAARYPVRFGPTSGGRLRVLHGAGSGVNVVAVEPRQVELVRE
jgi:YbbR domain-containing protein